MAIKAIHTMKVIDFSISDISEHLRTWLVTWEQYTYQDKKLDEHIYDVEDILEEEEIIKELRDELEAIKKAMKKYNTPYFRIIRE